MKKGNPKIAWGMTNIQDRPTPPRDGGWPYSLEAPAPPVQSLRELLQNPASELFAIGRVVTSMPSVNAVQVDIPRRNGRPMLCICLGRAINRLGGQSSFDLPEVGSHVLVYEMKSQTIGLVIGQVPALTTEIEMGVRAYISHLRGHTSKGPEGDLDPSAAGIGADFADASQGMPGDILPGDSGTVSEFGAAIYSLKYMSCLKGGELAKFEAFAIDDLARITARNLEVRTGIGETAVSSAPGGSWAESNMAPTEREALGMPPGDAELEIPPADYEEGEDGASGLDPGRDGLWRVRELAGMFGGAGSKFVMSPRSHREGGEGSLSDGSKGSADLGLASINVSLDGQVIARSVIGGGFAKTRAIAVPKRKIRHGDPFEAPEYDPEDFEFSEDYPSEYQARDYLAYLHGGYLPAPMAAAGDLWHAPDESDSDTGCPQASPESPGANVAAGGYLRPRPDPVDIRSVDPGLPSRRIYANDAMIMSLPDGTVIIRDGWGSQVSMSRGHILMSASKDVTIAAGRSIHLSAGDDITAGARMSVDITAAKGQARMLSGGDAFVGSNEGGLMLQSGRGRKYDPEARGERSGVPGILMKSEGAIVASGEQARFDLLNSFVVQGQSEDSPGPMIYSKARRVMVDSASDMACRLGGNFIQFGGSPGQSIRASGNIMTEGDLEAYLGSVKINAEEPETKVYPAKGWVSTEDALSPGFTGKASDGSDSKSRRNAARSRAGVGGDSSKVLGGAPYDPATLSYAISMADMASARAGFRTEEDYGSDGDDFQVPEAAWQREWEGAEDWGEGAEDEASKTAEYPGYKYWAGSGKAAVSYGESNVRRDGTAVPRDSLSKSGGKFEKKSMRATKRHP